MGSENWESGEVRESREGEEGEEGGIVSGTTKGCEGRKVLGAKRRGKVGRAV